MEARQLYIDVTNRQFVTSPETTGRAASPSFYAADVEPTELYFLKPTGLSSPLYEYQDYSANTVKLAIGDTEPAVLLSSWSALPTTVTATITSLVTGGSGTNEVQRLTFSDPPTTGGWAIQLPSRSATVSSVSSGVFTSASHGFYNGQQVTLSSFSISASSFANSVYYVVERTIDTFRIATTTSGTAIEAAVTSGGGTATIAAITTGQLGYNASAAEVQAALVSAGLSDDNSTNLVVTGSMATQLLFTYAGGSSNINFSNFSLAGSTLAAGAGLTGNVSLNTTELQALIDAGTTSVYLEVEVSDATSTQTYRQTATISDDIIGTGTTSPLQSSTSNGFRLMSPSGTVYEFSADNEGMLQSVATASTSAPSGILLRSADLTAYTLTVDNQGLLTTTLT
jgi:hypothetical protein